MNAVALVAGPLGDSSVVGGWMGTFGVLILVAAAAVSLAAAAYFVNKTPQPVLLRRSKRTDKSPLRHEILI